MKKTFKELAVNEIARGYEYQEEEKKYTCIFCQEAFEEGVIYTSMGRSVTAEKAVEEHMEIEHKSVFDVLIELEKSLTGLSETQTKLLKKIFEQKTNKEISEEMDISQATVRSHKFNLQKLKQQAKIILAIIYLAEIQNNEEKFEAEEELESDMINEANYFEGNTLDPFVKGFFKG